MRFPIPILAIVVSAAVLIASCSRIADEPPLPRTAPSEQSTPLPKTTVAMPTLPAKALRAPVVPSK